MANGISSVTDSDFVTNLVFRSEVTDVGSMFPRLRVNDGVVRS